MRQAPETDQVFFKVPKVIERLRSRRRATNSREASTANNIDSIRKVRLSSEAKTRKATPRKRMWKSRGPWLLCARRSPRAAPRPPIWPPSYYDRIAEINPRLNVYLSLTKERALAQAARVDEAAAKGDPLAPLAGIPVGIKDVLVMQGAPATAGSKILEGYRPPYDATAVAKLEAAGAVLLGKINCDEFAMGSSNENSAYGPVRNPVDTERVPGGSSGGSAAAVAANMAVATLGSDTGGSIRQPASFCGVVGVLPTYGRVSRYGLIAFASSLDRVGPFAANVRDAATMLERDCRATIRRTRPARRLRFRTTRRRATSRWKGCASASRRSTLPRGSTRRCGRPLKRVLPRLKKAGCTVKPVSLPHTKICGSHLLPDCDGRGQRQPGAL